MWQVASQYVVIFSEIIPEYHHFSWVPEKDKKPRKFSSIMRVKLILVRYKAPTNTDITRYFRKRFLDARVLLAMTQKDKQSSPPISRNPREIS